MKRIIVASVLGLAVSAVTSYGQGTIAFNTYFSTGYAPATWTSVANLAPSGFAGQQVSQAGFTADLLYSDSAGSGDTTDTATGTAMAQSGVTLTTLPSYGAGWIIGPAALFAYTTGPVTFTIELFQGASYAAAEAGTQLGYGSLTWTEQAGAIATGESAVGYFASFPGSSGYTAGENGYLTVQENPVPEPGTMAILGLGAVGLLALRRRNTCKA